MKKKDSIETVKRRVSSADERGRRTRRGDSNPGVVPSRDAFDVRVEGYDGDLWRPQMTFTEICDTDIHSAIVTAMARYSKEYESDFRTWKISAAPSGFGMSF